LKQETQQRKAHTDADGVRTVRTPGGAIARRLALVAAAIVVALAAVVVLRTLERPAPIPTESVVTSTGAAPAAASAASRHADGGARTVRAKPVRIEMDRKRDAAPDVAGEPAARQSAQSDPNEARPEIDARDYIAALRESGETGGIAAFPPPGTRPPRTGVIVPDDYQLPEGFMRHYQSTDDGGQLAPILTLAPGYELVDQNGKPIPLAKDRIVPPELAPPDLPVRMLEVPSTTNRAEGRR